MAKSNLMKPDFTEDLVSFMMQSMLTILHFPNAPYGLIPLNKFDERKTGGDLLIDSIAPIYIQCKRSFGYPDFSKAQIIKDRKFLGLQVNPHSLYFELRKKDESHDDFQHNKLLQTRNTLIQQGIGEAIYVAPLFLNRTVYNNAIHLSSYIDWISRFFQFRRNVFRQREIEIISSSGAIRFQNCPVIRNHVCIPPHEAVKTHLHKYSYTESGKQIAFHSPYQIQESFNLGEFLYNFMQYRNGQPTTYLIPLLESEFLLKALIDNYYDSNSNDIDSKNSILDSWTYFGERIRTDFGIEQYMLVKYDARH